ncbi:MAG: hypothetical protein ACREMP_08880 [Candidatus Tyrphobacter sp.]
MTPRFPVGLVVGIFIIVAILVAWHFVPPIDWKTFTGAADVQSAPTDSYASLDIRYEHPPIFDERYVMEDRNGASSFAYTVVEAAGPRTRESVTIKVPPHATYDVSFFFGQLVADGVWEVPSRPPRGDTSVGYTLTVRQTEDYQTNAHTVTFTDPHFWATVSGREFEIHLSPHGPLPNILELEGQGVHDARYEHLVDDFRTFGPAAFRAAVSRARANAHA